MKFRWHYGKPSEHIRLSRKLTSEWRIIAPRTADSAKNSSR